MPPSKGNYCLRLSHGNLRTDNPKSGNLGSTATASIGERTQLRDVGIGKQRVEHYVLKISKAPGSSWKRD